MANTRRAILIVSLFLIPAVLSAQSLDTAKIDQVLGRSGQKAGEVYRVGFPRTDLHVEIDGITLRPGFALGSWAAFSGNDADSSVMGDLVLTQDEVPKVMAKLRTAGFEISALHNHLFNETPHVMYMHYMGHGSAVGIAKSLKDALAESKTPLGTPPAPAPEGAPPAFVKIINDTLRQQGRWAGGVLAFGIARTAPVTEHGMTLTVPQGAGEAINFQEAGPGEVATTGDFVLTADEVNPVISALEAHDIQVTALHNHMLDEQPRLFFMHFWSVGDAKSVAEGIAAALSHIAAK